MAKETLEQLLKNSKKTDIGSYWPSGPTMFELCAMHNGKAIDAFNDIFRIGFLKGQRAERARRREAARNE